MNIHISSGAIIYKIENTKLYILLLYRKNTNSWHLPKGTQNTGETLEETTTREVLEETGLTIELGRYIGKLSSTYVRNNTTINKETHYFLAQPISGTIACHDHEHDEIVFVDYHVAISRLEHFSLYEEEGKILKMAESHFV